METVVVDERYHGPPNSGNGGYCCGLIAVQVANQVQVTLRRPPPLGTPMLVDAAAEDGGVEVLVDGLVVATATSCEPVRCDPPTTVTVDEAVTAAREYSGFQDHPFPTCWVCGPDREPGDGLRIFPGPLASGSNNHVAAPWIPRTDLTDDGTDDVPAEHVWAALDCTSYFGLGEDRPAVLGALTVTQHRPVRVGEEHVVHGWTRGPQDGRRLLGASAITTGAGDLVASGEATWVLITEAQLAQFVGRG